MKPFLVCLVLLSSCAGDFYGPRFFGPKGEFTPPPSSYDDPLFATLGPCLAGSVQIVAMDAGGMGVSRGSGVVVGPERVLTARHMVEGAASWNVKIGGRSVPARCIMRGEGPFDDWALLESAGRLGEAVPVLEYGRNEPLVYSRAVAIGFGLGWNSPSVTVGHIQSYSDGMCRFSAPITFGNSGGGLFAVVDGRLRLIAITVAVGVGKGSAVEHMGIGVPVPLIRRQGGLPR